MTELIAQRAAAARIQTFRTEHHLGPQADRLVGSAEALSSAYLILAKGVMEGNLRLADNRAELALANCALGLIALSQRDHDALLKIGSELVKYDALGRNYMNMLLKEPDMHPGVRYRWKAIMEAHEAGLGQTFAK